jgi:DNA-binding NtrC family response regulator
MPDSLARILIVDDDQSIRTSMSQILIEIGYGVSIAEDGVAALLEIQKGIPGILISDLNMPRMSGFELLSGVRRHFPTIKTIAMSGSFCGDEVPLGVDADAYYQKGGSIYALLRILETLPHIELTMRHSASPDAPQWIHRDLYDSSRHENATSWSQ